MKKVLVGLAGVSVLTGVALIGFAALGPGDGPDVGFGSISLSSPSSSSGDKVAGEGRKSVSSVADTSVGRSGASSSQAQCWGEVDELAGLVGREVGVAGEVAALHSDSPALGQLEARRDASVRLIDSLDGLKERVGCEGASDVATALSESQADLEEARRVVENMTGTDYQADGQEE